MRRVKGGAVVAVLAGLAVATGTATPAAAQTTSDPDAGYYRAEITAIEPAVPGVTARVDPAGEWIEVTNSGPDEVIILGYSREPYLRITATGVEENQLSSSAVLNRALFADLPTNTDGNHEPPKWQPTATRPVARWHDHRIHWMGRARPPVVAADPTHPHLVGTWDVHATAAGAPVEITGQLRWLGKPPERISWFQITTWVVLGLMTLTVLVLTVALIRARRRGRTPPPGQTALTAPTSVRTG